jgi:hypothetical protein
MTKKKVRGNLWSKPGPDTDVYRLASISAARLVLLGTKLPEEGKRPQNTYLARWKQMDVLPVIVGTRYPGDTILNSRPK